MYARKIALLILILFSALPVVSQTKDAILGKWLNASGEGQILVYKTGDTYAGKLIWLKEVNNRDGQLKRDEKNPKSALKNRPLLGIELLQNFVYLKDGVWEEGSIYDPKTGKTYSCTISMISSDKLSVRGYVGISLLGRTETWQRAY